MKVVDLIIYPIKSCSGIHINKAYVEEMGLKYDRRMMLIDANGRFISQREFNKMALIGAEFTENGFIFYNKRNRSDHTTIPFDAEIGHTTPVSVWEHKFETPILSNNYEQWFENFLDTRLRIAIWNQDTKRLKGLKKRPGKVKLSAADGYPFLFISNASLNDLNKRLEQAVPMDRFRPNVVFDSKDPYAEESLGEFQIGPVRFSMIKPCARCMMTTIDQKTGNKLVEPLKTLSSFKREGNNVYFGMNAIALNEGEISIDDELL